jgi:hypothetical protein
MNIEVTRLTFTSHRLPPVLDDLRLVFFTDLHMGRRPGSVERQLKELLEIERGDVLLSGGDFVNLRYHWSSVTPFLESLRKPDLALAVPGNWDYRQHRTLVGLEDSMQRAGFKLLKNSRCEYRKGESRIAFVGLDDVRHGQPDPVQAFDGLDPSVFTVVLCHNPDILLQLDGFTYDLLLCGHTHGGQIRIPGWGPLRTSTRLGKKYDMGRFDLENDRMMYITRGIGSGHVRFRWNCNPELTVITLACL